MATEWTRIGMINPDILAKLVPKLVRWSKCNGLIQTCPGRSSAGVASDERGASWNTNDRKSGKQDYLNSV